MLIDFIGSERLRLFAAEEFDETTAKAARKRGWLGGWGFKKGATTPLVRRMGTILHVDRCRMAWSVWQNGFKPAFEQRSLAKYRGGLYCGNPLARHGRWMDLAISQELVPLITVLNQLVCGWQLRFFATGNAVDVVQH